VLTKSKLWPELERVLATAGIELYDVDMPDGEGSTLRIYISRSEGVGIDHCTSSSKLIEHDPELSELLEHYNLEVSSPGINRRLTRPEHFAKAVGERIKVTMKKLPSKPGMVIRGTLMGFAEDCLQVADEDSKQTVALEMKDVSKARVDFLFD
jgi:ribosome maturation factor RimP